MSEVTIPFWNATLYETSESEKDYSYLQFIYYSFDIIEIITMLHHYSINFIQARNVLASVLL